MEGGNKAVIGLSSDLDVKSSDMLVSVNEPQFQHNRQQYQGKYLPTSLRFEHDGWAAGWDVYNFEVQGDDITTFSGDFYVARRRYNNNPAYVFVFQKQVDLKTRVDYARLLWNAVSSASGGVEVEQDGETARFSGELNGQYFTVSMNPVTHESGIDFSDGANLGYDIVTQDDGKSRVKVFDVNTRLLFEYEFHPGSSLYASDIEFAPLKTYADGKYTYDGAANVAEFRDGSFVLDGMSYPYSIRDGRLHVEYSRRLPLEATGSIMAKNWIQTMNDIEVKPYREDEGFVLPETQKITDEARDDNYRVRVDVYEDRPSTDNPGKTERHWVGYEYRYTDSVLHQMSQYRVQKGSGTSISAGQKMNINGWLPIWCGVSLTCTPDMQDNQSVARLELGSADEGSLHLETALQPDYLHVKLYEREGATFAVNRWIGTECTPVTNPNLTRSAPVLNHQFKIWVLNDGIDPAEYDWENADESDYVEVEVAGSLPAGVIEFDDPEGDVSPFLWWRLTENGQPVAEERVHIVTQDAHVAGSNGVSYIRVERNYAREPYTVTVHDPETGESVQETRYHSCTVDVTWRYNAYMGTDGKVAYSRERLSGEYLNPTGHLASWWQSHHPISEFSAKDDKFPLTDLFSTEDIAQAPEAVVMLSYRTALNNGLAYCGLFKGNFSFDVSFFDKLTDLNAKQNADITTAQEPAHIIIEGASISESQARHLYIDRGEHELMTLDFMGLPSEGNLIMQFVAADEVSNAFTLYTTKAANYDRWFEPFDRYVPSTLYYNHTDYIREETPTMLPVQSNVTFNFSYTPKIVYELTDTVTSDGEFSYVGLVPQNRLQKANDVFLRDVLPLWQDKILLEITELDQNYEQQVRVHVDGHDLVRMTYKANLERAVLDAEGNDTGLKSGTFIEQLLHGTLDGYDYVLSSFKADQSQVSFIMTVAYDVPLTAILPYSSHGTLVSIYDNDYTYDYNGIQFTVNAVDGLFRVRDDAFRLTDIAGTYVASIDSSENVTFDAVVKGPFRTADLGVQVVSFNDVDLRVLVDGVEQSVPVGELLSSRNMMKFLYTDVTDPVLKQTEIAAADMNEEMTFLRQQWDTTTATENFWWIDPTHVLCLKQDRFLLRVKADMPDDWNGDMFEDEAYWDRSRIIDGNISKYGVTSAYNGATALVYSVLVVHDSLIRLRFYDPLDGMRVFAVDVPIVKREIGSELNASNTCLNTYSNLRASELTEARMSATCRDGKILFGIHYNNNFNQWALCIDRDTGEYYVVQGYGFVGANGDLTGGEIPQECFSNMRGFNGTVRNLASLKAQDKFCTTLAEVYAIDAGEGVYGTDSQQWYVYREVTGIVSHLTWDQYGGFWNVQVLPVTSNLSQKYASGSFASYTLSDFFLTIRGFWDLFPGSNSGDPTFATVAGLLKAALAVAGAPQLYMLFPKSSTFLELQQTFGQAAYVHRNLSDVRQQKDLTEDSDLENTNDMGEYWTKGKNRFEDNLSELLPFQKDEVTFNTHIIKQFASIDDFYGLFFAQLMPALLSGGIHTETTEVKISAHRNKTSTSEEGYQYTSTYTKNVDLSASTENVLRGICNSVNSAVAGALSLDMFYTTADAQEISAGPGWVNHNFVAQCVASSVTAHHMEFNQIGLMFVIKKLTLLQLEALKRTEELAADFLKENAESVSGLTVWGAINVGYYISLAMLAGEKALRVHIDVLSKAIDVLGEVLDAMGADRMRAVNTMSKSTHTVDPEAKHAYGDKAEVFMYPCFDAGIQEIPDETVEVVAVNTPWKASVPLTSFGSKKIITPIGSPRLEGLVTHSNNEVVRTINGDVHYFVSNVQGNVRYRALPEKTAYVLGVESFLQKTPFRNENIGESEPVFPTAPFQDYIIDERWQLGHCASVGMSLWTSCRDTKLIDGELSNVVVSDEFCGIASPYTAIEVKRGIERKYLRPIAVTPNVLGLNISGKNACYNRKAYHAFDGYGYRVVRWMGAAGLNKEKRTWLYAFLVNDRFKRSNKLPLNSYLGNFNADPICAVQGDENDSLYVLVTQPEYAIGMEAGTIGEDKSSRRYAIPVFTEFVQTLPAVVKTISSMQLAVMDGVTSLTTSNRDLQSAYKAPVSVDFAIGKTMYRYTNEYICMLEQKSGITVTQEQVPCLGLTYLGSTQNEAYFYSQATRKYYVFTGGTSLQVVDMIERFRNVRNGYYDFINQEVLMPCLATFNRLDSVVKDDEDETDNVIVPRLKNSRFVGEVAPPLDTIYNTRSWFRTLSLPCGLTYQGPNRCIINRFVLQDHMIQQVKDNYGKWKRVFKEKYHPFRGYKAKYERVDEQIGDELEVKGWTHNPFLLVTAPLGITEQTDCMFEWEVTFCWPVEMDRLYPVGKYAVVCIQAETMTPGGKVIAQRPVHVYLTKELFTRTGNYGYYSFRYQSNCGAGNRERLHVWSDQYICVSSLQCEYKPVTQKRTEILTQQVDIQQLEEI